MKNWETQILQARISLEEKTGYTPSHVILRQEVWTDLNFDETTAEFMELWEIHGMQVAVSDTLDKPFDLLIRLEALED